RAIGLDPGKLTIPADLIEDDEDISDGLSFTDSPDATVEAATAAAAKPTPIPAGQQTTALSRDELLRTSPVEPDYARAGAGGPGSPTGDKKRGKGLLIGIGIFVVLVLAAAAAVGLTITRRTPEAAPPATSATTTT